MHTFALYAQIQTSRDQVLKILAGIAAAQPTPIYEQHLIYQQTQLANSQNSKKAPSAKQVSQNQRLFYHKLVREVHSGDSLVQWNLLAEDIPEPGAKNVISRTTMKALMTETDLERFRGGSKWYKYINQYLTLGHRFICSNIIVRVVRVLTVPEGTGALEPLDAPDPTISDCRPLDPSGTFLVEATIRVEDGHNSRLMEQALQELTSFKKQMEGSVELRAPDRLAMDTRVKAG